VAHWFQSSIDRSMGSKLRDGRRYHSLPIVLTFAIAGRLLSFSGGSLAWAQEARVAIEPRTPPRAAATGSADRLAPNIRVNSDLVLIPVMVTDQQDRLITGLEREHFRIWDGKTEQVISHFAADDVPVSIGVVFDSSGSMGSKLRKSRAAVSEFIRTANPEDEFSLVQFNDRAQLLQRFTDRAEDIQSRLMFIESRGRTALLDALILSLNEMRHAKHNRKAILIISDGGDNDSRFSTKEVKARLREANVQVYSIGIMEPLGARARSVEEMEGAALLDDLARQTGGRLFEVDDLNILPDIAAKIGAALRNQYVLGYVPTSEMRDGKYHRVQVKIARPKGVPPLRTSFRTGYFAPAE
jgi:Ca-activated chloride channel family protein